MDLDELSRLGTKGGIALALSAIHRSVVTLMKGMSDPFLTKAHFALSGLFEATEHRLAIEWSSVRVVEEEGIMYRIYKYENMRSPHKRVKIRDIGFAKDLPFWKHLDEVNEQWGVFMLTASWKEHKAADYALVSPKADYFYIVEVWEHNYARNSRS